MNVGTLEKQLRQAQSDLSEAIVEGCYPPEHIAWLRLVIKYLIAAIQEVSNGGSSPETYPGSAP